MTAVLVSFEQFKEARELKKLAIEAREKVEALALALEDWADTAVFDATTFGQRDYGDEDGTRDGG